MVTQQRGNGRANALKGELGIHLEETTTAPAEIVYDRLEDVRNHLEWGGKMQPKQTFRLLSIDAPAGPALVGTEFKSTGADAMGRFADSSVVTEATRPSVFEFVTEARLSTKRGKVVEWTNIHRMSSPHGVRAAGSLTRSGPFGSASCRARWRCSRWPGFARLP